MIRHLLLDADGVVQAIPGGGQVGRAHPLLGDRSAELVARFVEDERPSLRGESDFDDDLRSAVDRHDVEVDVATLYRELWLVVEVSAEMTALVHRLRAAGYGVHLGTNQHRRRASLMRTELGYDELFDVSCYSWELGAAKPEPAYFERALARIEAPADQVLFVDDNLANVEAARGVGLAAEHWELSRGFEELLDLFGRHGVEISDAPG